MTKTSNEWRHNNRDRFNEKVRDYKHRNPSRVIARRKVQYAIASGALIRPDHCSSCSVECVPEAHHEDHNKPLEVDWLCRSCHCKRDIAKRKCQRETLIGVA